MIQAGVAAPAGQADPLTAAVLGEWTKTTGLLIVLKSDGSFSGKRGSAKGAWKCLSTTERKFEISNRTGKDTLTLSADGQRLQGLDETGAAVEYVKGDQRDAQKPGRPGQPVAGTTPAAISNAENVAALLKKAAPSLVIIEGKTASGSGFIANLGGSRYLLTNQHVLALAEGGKFTLVDRTPLQLGQSAAAVDHDVARIAVPAGSKALECMQQVDKNASIGDEVVVLGNADGQRVINPIRGKLVGIGPNLVEVDAAFQPGNSGSPIIHLRTGQVIGVATYVVVRRFSDVPASSDWNKVRRFGYRLDSIERWQPIQAGEYFAEGAQQARIKQLTEDLVALWKDFGENRRITPGFHQNPLLQQPIADFLKVMRTPHYSENLATSAKKDFLWSLHNISQNDVANARSKTQYDYFQRSLADEASAREEIYKALEKVVMMR